MSDQLKPCPFCRGEAEIERRGTTRQSQIYVCQECGCRLETGEIFGVEHWNRRPIEDDLCTRLRTTAQTLRTRLEVMERERETDALLWRSAIDIAESNAREGERALAERDEARRERDEARADLAALVVGLPTEKERDEPAKGDDNA